jgi:hypothetical protein
MLSKSSVQKKYIQKIKLFMLLLFSLFRKEKITQIFGISESISVDFIVRAEF